jgi:hypothetical protein
MTITQLAPDRRTHARRDAFDGVRAMLPWPVGVIPFGMVVGMTVRSSGISTAVGLAGTLATSVVAQRRSAALAVAAGMSTLWVTTILGALV